MSLLNLEGLSAEGEVFYYATELAMLRELDEKLI
jgi:hypothetical protein